MVRPSFFLDSVILSFRLYNLRWALRWSVDEFLEVDD